jgi:hypothetical protein
MILNKSMWKQIGIVAVEILLAAVTVAGIIAILVPVYAKP